MANWIINDINIVCDNTAILNDIMEKYVTDGILNFSKIHPIPDEVMETNCFSTRMVQALCLYLSIINPHNEAYEGHPLRQKYGTVSEEEMEKLLEDLKQHGDDGLSALLDINMLPFTDGKAIYDIYGSKVWTEDYNPEGFIDEAKEYINNIRKYGAPNPGKWAELNWGTCTCGRTTSECKVDGNTLNTCIETRWNPPHKVLMKLSELYPDCIIYNKYKSEFWCEYVQAVYNKGALTDDIKI